MYTCGIDIGSRSIKAVILDEDGTVRGRGFRITGGRPSEAAQGAYEEALAAVRLKTGSVASVVATGYGRRLVAFAETKSTAVTCHATGAYHMFPKTRNVIDLGALRSSAIRLDEEGRVHRFRFNDRCGAGAGRFLERTAETLEIPLEEIGQLALFSRNPVQVPSVCSVLAETEILSHISREEKPADILRGVFEALAERVLSMVMQVWTSNGETTLTGGTAKNAGMVVALEQALGGPVNIHHDSEFAGAIGAALIARDQVIKKLSGETTV